ncbi:MAG TPA: aspartyl-phosphate phosphatase Spo0E family protein [Thermoanaerobacterales bacterium]|nr:aspartyl-phosphate phosphatase Spo0E family protein [Thermoanaerobacterales bacterium]
MCETKNITEKIEEVRNKMNDLIKEKGDLLDPEVIIASQMLDAVLNEYNYILKKRNRQLEKEKE